MTTFRSSLAWATTLLLAGCEQQPGVEERNVGSSAAAPALDLPAAMPADLAAEVPGAAPASSVTGRPSLAGSEHPTATYQRCMNTGEAGKGVTSAMRECLGAELKRQDERLNSAYRTAMAGIETGQQTYLRSLQRTWILQRDKDCQRKAEPNRGGTLYPVVLTQCLVDATITRAGWLETYLPGKK